MTNQFISYIAQFLPIILGLAIMYVMMSVKITGKKIRIIKGDNIFVPSADFTSESIRSEDIKKTMSQQIIYDNMITEGIYKEPSLISQNVIGSIPVHSKDEKMTLYVSNQRAVLKNTIYFSKDSGTILAKTINYNLKINQIKMHS